MSASLIVEFTVKDPELYREGYASKAGQMAKQDEAEALAANTWEVLYGDGSLTSGALMRFPDRDTVMRWYSSPEYQLLIDVRGDARKLVPT